MSFFSHIFVQRAFSQDLLLQQGIAHVSVAGDTRFDRVMTVFEQKKAIPLAEKFKNETLTLVVGSSWEEDMKVILPFFKEKKRKVKLIIAPHEISENSLNKHETLISPLSCVRFSKADPEKVQDYNVLLIDSIGMLVSLYQYADFAYVGGAFGAGLHNTLEPAVFGIPVLFGNKNYQKFTEAVELETLGAGIPVGEAQTFSKKMENLVENTVLRKELGEKASNYVCSQAGATERILDTLSRWL